MLSQRMPNFFVLTSKNVFLFREIGHFTVLVNEKNVAVGCAMVTFYLDDIEYFLVACNYAVTNTLGRRVYSSCPVAGIQCPNGLDDKFTSLCV